MPSIVTGWGAVIAGGVVLLGLAAMAVFLVVRFAVRGWKSGLAIALVSLPLMPLLATHVFGDVSRYVPASVFSDGPGGKDQIVVASALSTVCSAVILAAIIVGIVWRPGNDRAR